MPREYPSVYRFYARDIAVDVNSVTRGTVRERAERRWNLDEDGADTRAHSRPLAI